MCLCCYSNLADVISEYRKWQPSLKKSTKSSNYQCVESIANDPPIVLTEMYRTLSTAVPNPDITHRLWQFTDYDYMSGTSTFMKRKQFSTASRYCGDWVARVHLACTILVFQHGSCGHCSVTILDLNTTSQKPTVLLMRPGIGWNLGLAITSWTSCAGYCHILCYNWFKAEHAASRTTSYWLDAT